MKDDEVEKKNLEKRIVSILTDQKLSSIKAMLEKDHSIDCTFLLMLDKGRWKHAKKFMKQLNLALPDGTFRIRMIEIEANGLAKHEKIDNKKRMWAITEFGELVDQQLLTLFNHIGNEGNYNC